MQWMHSFIWYVCVFFLFCSILMLYLSHSRSISSTSPRAFAIGWCNQSSCDSCPISDGIVWKGHAQEDGISPPCTYLSLYRFTHLTSLSGPQGRDGISSLLRLPRHFLATSTHCRFRLVHHTFLDSPTSPPHANILSYIPILERTKNRTWGHQIIPTLNVSPLFIPLPNASFIQIYFHSSTNLTH